MADLFLHCFRLGYVLLFCDCVQGQMSHIRAVEICGNHFRLRGSSGMGDSTFGRIILARLVEAPTSRKGSETWGTPRILGAPDSVRVDFPVVFESIQVMPSG